MKQRRERRSISGVRGALDVLTMDKARAYTLAYATVMREYSTGNTILLGTDTRRASSRYKLPVAEALLSAGWDVIDLGIVPTPTVQIAIPKFDAAGAVMITGSHNPIEESGLKFLKQKERKGTFLDIEQVTNLFECYDSGKFATRRTGKLTRVEDHNNEFDDYPYTVEYLKKSRSGLEIANSRLLDYHIARMIDAMGREIDLIRGANFKVVVDCCGGAGIPLNMVLLDHLYCETTVINAERGEVNRKVDATKEDLDNLCQRLEKEEDIFDVAFVTDTDNDRAVLIARDGDSGRYVPLEPDYTFAVVIDHVLASQPREKIVVTNWSTSMLAEDIVQRHHALLKRVPTGEVYTATEMMHYNALIGGEGSCAGIIDKRVGMGRDLLVAMWHTLSCMAKLRTSLFDIVGSFPRYYRASENMDFLWEPQETARKLNVLQVEYAKKDNIEFITREDGLIVYFADRSRVHIRPSNTEPILRIRCEARNAEQTEKFMAEARENVARASKV